LVSNQVLGLCFLTLPKRFRVTVVRTRRTPTRGRLSKVSPEVTETSPEVGLELAADCVRNQGRRSVTLFVYTTRTLTEEATWIR